MPYSAHISPSTTDIYPSSYQYKYLTLRLVACYNLLNLLYTECLLCHYDDKKGYFIFL